MARIFDLLTQVYKAETPVVAQREREMRADFREILEGPFTDIFQIDPGRKARYDECDEMDARNPLIAKVLDIIADEAVPADPTTGRSFRIVSRNTEVEKLGNDLLERIKFEDVVGDLARDAAKYGEVLRKPIYLTQAEAQDAGVGTYGILSLEEIREPTKLEPVLDIGRLQGWRLGNSILPPWEIWHVAMPGRSVMREKAPHSFHGRSWLEPARPIWRAIKLSENALLMARVTGTVKQKVYYFPAGNIDPREIPGLINEYRRALGRKTYVSPEGEFLRQVDPLAYDEAIWWPVVEGMNTSVGTIGGDVDIRAIEDIKYWQNILFASLGVPREYLQYERSGGGLVGKDLCLTGDTRIRLLDGTSPTIREMAETPDRTFPVYSVDLESGELRPGTAHSARLTGRKPIWEVDLRASDTGEVHTVRCTGNHPFLLKNRTYVRADELEPGDSLAGLYFRESSRETGQHIEGYEMFYRPFGRGWKYTHAQVCDSVHGELPAGHVRHHVDHDRRNNTPENLRPMTQEEHRSYHASENAGWAAMHARRARDPEYDAWWRQMASEAQRKGHETKIRRYGGGGWKAIWARSPEVFEGRTAVSGPEHHKWSGIGFDVVEDALALAPQCVTVTDLLEDLRRKHEGLTRDVLKYRLAGRGLTVEDLPLATDLDGTCPLCGQTFEAYQRLNYHYRGCKTEENAGHFPKGHVPWNANHTVVAVRFTGEEEDVYDLSVDEYHNFLIEGAQVFVHNSFEDIRFARSVRKVQKILADGVIQMVRVELALRGIDPFEEEFDVQTGVISFLENKQRAESLKFAAEVGQNMQLLGQQLGIEDTDDWRKFVLRTMGNYVGSSLAMDELEELIETEEAPPPPTEFEPRMPKEPEAEDPEKFTQNKARSLQVATHDRYASTFVPKQGQLYPTRVTEDRFLGEWQEGKEVDENLVRLDEMYERFWPVPVQEEVS